jgi:hypothetical protein
MKPVQLFPRALLLLTMAVALLGGLGSGLARLGWQMDSLSRDWMLVHGPLMISGFLGTLICLERAVALAARYRWSIAVPAINAAGTVTLLVMPGAVPARVLLTAGSLGLVVLFGFMLRLRPSRDVIIMAAGAVCWLLGNGLWLAGEPVYQVVHLWTAFLILTIVGERLELSRVRRLTPVSENLLVLAVVVYLAGVLLTALALDAGIRLAGVGAVLIAGWLLRYDVTRRTIRQTGLPRYMAACLMLGYIWLGFGGVMAIGKGAIYAGPDYGLILHAYLLGFVFSMIFGHAPMILPAMTGLRLSYAPIFYLPLLLLHTTLVYRMYGNLALDFTARQWGGLFNAAAVLLFMAMMAFTVVRSNTARATEGGEPVS